MMVGVGNTTTAPTLALDVRENISGAAVYVLNDGGLSTRDGMTMDCGEDNNPTCAWITFRAGDGSPTVGSITGDGDNTITYNTSSDLRLKNVLGAMPLEDALQALLEVTPIAYTAKGGGPAKHGFGAQHLAPVTKGVVRYDEGTDIYQMDYGKLTPYLWRGWQYHQERIEALTQEIIRLGGDPGRLRDI